MASIVIKATNILVAHWKTPDCFKYFFLILKSLSHVYKSRNERIEEILSEIENCRNSKKKSILYFQLGLYFYYHQKTGHDRDMLTAFMTSFKLNTENFAGLNRVIQFYYDKSEYDTAMTYINKGLKTLTKVSHRATLVNI